MALAFLIFLPTVVLCCINVIFIAFLSHFYRIFILLGVSRDPPPPPPPGYAFPYLPEYRNIFFVAPKTGKS